MADNKKRYEHQIWSKQKLAHIFAPHVGIISQFYNIVKIVRSLSLRTSYDVVVDVPCALLRKALRLSEHDTLEACCHLLSAANG